jgi:cell division protein FtsQ
VSRTDALPFLAPPAAFRTAAWVLAVVLIGGALLPFAPRLMPRALPVTLEIAGDFERVRPGPLRQAIAPLLTQDFYRLDLGAVKAAVEAQPWVAHARVERAWPATVRIHVWEHKAYARWGASALLSDDGVVFAPPAQELARSLPAGLPRLDGPPGQQRAVREAFETLCAELAGTPFMPAALAENARGEWTAITAAGIELRLGRGAPTDAVARLAGPVRMALNQRLTEVAYVDLHYVNGFAVGWRDGGGGNAHGEPAVAPQGDDAQK